jgi:hypothetical protein
MMASKVNAGGITFRRSNSRTTRMRWVANRLAIELELDQWESQSVVDRNRVNECVSIFSSDMQIVNVEYWSFGG